MPQSGGAFLPNADTVVTGDWTFTQNVSVTGNLTVTGTISDSGSAFISPTITGTVAGGATYTAPVFTTPTLGAASGTSLALTATTNQMVTGASSNLTTVSYPASSGAVTLTMPNTTDTMVGRATTDTLTNKTLTAPVMTTPTLGAASGTSLALVATTNQMVTGASSNLTTVNYPASSGAVTLTMPNTTDTVVARATTDTLTNKTLTGAINTDYKALAASITYTSDVVPDTITGFSWTVVPGTYVFSVELPTTMTTNGGLGVAFNLTTAVLTSIRYNTYASTAADNGTAVSTTGTTAASGTLVFNSKTAAYTIVRITGSMVVGTGGTFVWAGCQETSASGGDVTIVLIGATAQLTRVA